MEQKTGILLVNLGSPDSYDVKDVRPYLHDFLMDKRVIDSPYLVRKILVDFLIIPRRAENSAEAYKSIWWEEGSPLIVISRNLQKALQEKVSSPVELGMRYGNPSTLKAVSSLIDDHKVNKIFLIPLYPHYAMSSYETAVVEVERVLKKKKAKVDLTTLPPFYAEPLYIDALVKVAQKYLDTGFDHLLFSYHGLPERHLRKSDPTKKHCLQVENCCSVPSPAHEKCYRMQTYKTTELFIEHAGIDKSKCSVSFQSRLGKDPWLQPYTDKEIERLAHEGVKKLLVICPAFVSDCLETLEEIAVEGKEEFLNAGGEEFTMIPCLNCEPEWLEVMVKWCEDWEKSNA